MKQMTIPQMYIKWNYAKKMSQKRSKTIFIKGRPSLFVRNHNILSSQASVLLGQLGWSDQEKALLETMATDAPSL